MFGKNKHTITVKVGGMSCAHCSARVEKALNAIAGISAKVDLKKGTATVSSAGEINTEEIYAAILEAGYQVG